jgi:hypothetical protein
MSFNRTANVDPGALDGCVTADLVRYAFGRLGREIGGDRVDAVVSLVAECGGFDEATKWAYSHCDEQRALDVRAVWSGLFDGLELRLIGLRETAQFNADPTRRHEAITRVAVIKATMAGDLELAA